jgi:hypothetical protein
VLSLEVAKQLHWTMLHIFETAIVTDISRIILHWKWTPLGVPSQRIKLAIYSRTVRKQAPLLTTGHESEYRVYNLKGNPMTITYYNTKMKWEHIHPHVIVSQSPRDTRLKVTQVARPLLTPVALKLCRCEHGVFTSRACVILEHSFSWTSFAAVREAIKSAYPDKEVL